jgi:hypothetical protein
MTNLLEELSQELGERSKQAIEKVKCGEPDATAQSLMKSFKSKAICELTKFNLGEFAQLEAECKI